MEDLPRITSIYPHFKDTAFVALIERSGARYALSVDSLSGCVTVRPVEGRVVVRHVHQAFDRYDLKVTAGHVGDDTPMLDPLCAALVGKGWSTDLLNLKFERHHRLDSAYALKRTWEDVRTSFYITDVPDPKLHHPLRRDLPAWIIGVEWYLDQPHIFVHATFPDIYEKPEALRALLEAIESIPNPDSFKSAPSLVRAS